MGNLLSDLAKKMIQDKILDEVKKLIRQKASTAFIASVLPPQDDHAHTENLTINAELSLNVKSAAIDCTIHLAGDERKELMLADESQDFEIHTCIPVRCPKDLSSSETLSLNLDSLSLAASLNGIGFSKKMMGAGATVHGIKLLAELSGKGTGVWKS